MLEQHISDACEAKCEKEPMWVSLSSLPTDITTFTAVYHSIIGEALLMLAP